MSRIEQNDREHRRKKAKAAVIALVLIAATVTALAVLWQFERRLFECILYAFGLIGFVRVMLVLATWIDDLTIESQPLSYRDYAERPGTHAKAGK